MYRRFRIGDAHLSNHSQKPPALPHDGAPFAIVLSGDCHHPRRIIASSSDKEGPILGVPTGRGSARRNISPLDHRGLVPRRLARVDQRSHPPHKLVNEYYPGDLGLTPTNGVILIVLRPHRPSISRPRTRPCRPCLPRARRTPLSRPCTYRPRHPRP